MNQLLITKSIRDLHVEALHQTRNNMIGASRAGACVGLALMTRARSLLMIPNSSNHRLCAYPRTPGVDVPH